MAPQNMHQNLLIENALIAKLRNNLNLEKLKLAKF